MMTDYSLLDDHSTLLFREVRGISSPPTRLLIGRWRTSHLAGRGRPEVTRLRIGRGLLRYSYPSLVARHTHLAGRSRPHPAYARGPEHVRNGDDGAKGRFNVKKKNLTIKKPAAHTLN